MNSASRVFRILLIGSVIGAILLCGIELATRCLIRYDPKNPYGNIRRTIRTALDAGSDTEFRLIEFNPVLTYSLRKNLDNERIAGDINGGHVDYTVSTNAVGLRNPPIRPKGTRTRILCLGDSTTFGIGVNDDQTYPAQLQRVLDERLGTGRSDVINAGVFAYSTVQTLAYFEHFGLGLEPDVVVVSSWFNDQAGWFLMSDADILKRLRIHVWEDFLLSHSRTYVALKYIKMFLFLGRLPNAERARVTLEEYDHNLRRLHEMCAQRHVPLVFVWWPSPEEVRNKQVTNPYYGVVQKIAEETRMPLVGLIDAFAAEQDDLYVDFLHGTPRACRIEAEQVADAILKHL